MSTVLALLAAVVVSLVISLPLGAFLVPWLVDLPQRRRRALAHCRAVATPATSDTPALAQLAAAATWYGATLRAITPSAIEFTAGLTDEDRRWVRRMLEAMYDQPESMARSTEHEGAART